MYYILGNVVIFMMIWDMMALRLYGITAKSGGQGAGSKKGITALRRYGIKAKS